MTFVSQSEPLSKYTTCVQDYLHYCAPHPIIICRFVRMCPIVLVSEKWIQLSSWQSRYKSSSESKSGRWLVELLVLVWFFSLPFQWHVAPQCFRWLWSVAFPFYSYTTTWLGSPSGTEPGTCYSVWYRLRPNSKWAEPKSNKSLESVRSNSGRYDDRLTNRRQRHCCIRVIFISLTHQLVSHNAKRFLSGTKKVLPLLHTLIQKEITRFTLEANADDPKIKTSVLLFESKSDLLLERADILQTPPVGPVLTVCRVSRRNDGIN